MKKERRLQRMGTEKMLPLILSFSLPSIVSMTAMALYNVVDTIFVGRLGTEAIAGLTLIIPLQMLVLAFGLLIGVGAASYISRSLGAQKVEEAHHIFSSSILLSLITAAFITLLGVTQLRPLLAFIGRNSGAVPQAYDYGFVLVFGFPFMIFNLLLSQCARAEGNPNIAMTSQLAGTFLNIALDPVLIFSLKMGVRGAALATVMANMVALAIIAAYFVSPRSHLKLRPKLLLPSGSILRELLKAGFPSFARHIAASIVATLTNSLLAAYGAFALAIMGISNRLIMIFFMPMVGTAQGFMPIAGYNYGAGHFDRVKKAFWSATLLVTAICTLGWVLIQLFPQVFIRIFSHDPRVITQGKSSLQIINALLPLVGFQIIGATVYQAMGKGLAGFILSIARQTLVFLPVVLLFQLLFGLRGIFLTFPTADLVASLIIMLWLRHTFRTFDHSPPSSDDVLDDLGEGEVFDLEVR
jgi:putative MATE family efflux protein